MSLLSAYVCLSISQTSVHNLPPRHPRSSAGVLLSHFADKKLRYDVIHWRFLRKLFVGNTIQMSQAASKLEYLQAIWKNGCPRWNSTELHYPTCYTKAWNRLSLCFHNMLPTSRQNSKRNYLIYLKKYSKQRHVVQSTSELRHLQRPCFSVLQSTVLSHSFFYHYEAALCPHSLNITLDYTRCEIISEHQFSRTCIYKPRYIFTVVWTTKKNKWGEAVGHHGRNWSA